MRRKHKTDANQKEIVEHLRRAGLSVAITSMVGSGFPDLVVANSRKTVLVELKDGGKSKSAQKLTPDEIDFIDRWKGEIIVATDAKTILNLFTLKYLWTTK